MGNGHLTGYTLDLLNAALNTAERHGTRSGLAVQPTVAIDAAERAGERTKTSGKCHPHRVLISIARVRHIAKEGAIPVR